MYTVCVRDHAMIAHSFRGALFGPAQKLHGATYVVDVEFRGEALGSSGVVVDIGRASAAVRAVLSKFEYSNLDEQPAFEGVNTTTEFLARFVFDRMVERLATGELGEGSESIRSLRVVLHESHVAWASFEGEVPSAAKGKP